MYLQIYLWRSGSEEIQFDQEAVCGSISCGTELELEQEKLSPSFPVESYDKRQLTPTLPDYSDNQEAGPGYSPGQSFTSLTDVDHVCLPGYLTPLQDTTGSLPLYKVSEAEVDYLSSTEHQNQSGPGSSSGAAANCKVPVYEVSDPRLDLTTGQVHIHIDLNDNSDPTSEVLNLSNSQDLSADSDTVLPTYYDMSSTVAMDDTESSGHSSYPYFSSAGASSSALGSSTGSSSTSPYSLTNRTYADPTSAYNLYSQYYGAAYPYGMNFTSSGSSSSSTGFGPKGEYGSSYYGSYASWTGNPYRLDLKRKWQ